MPSNNNANFIWDLADTLRGTYKPAQYGSVILPFTILRRLDCVLGATKQAVLDEHALRMPLGVDVSPFLTKKSGHSFFNHSAYDLQKMIGDAANVKANLTDYISKFSSNVVDIFARFDFEKQIEKLDANNLLYSLVKSFANIDLHPEAVSNIEMGLMFEHLIRRFAESSNETAGEHFTPREVIRLMVDLVFTDDREALTKPGVVRSIYDPTAGTGGMLSVAGERLRSMNENARLVMYGQEINDESYAICKSDLLIKGQNADNIVQGDTLAAQGHTGQLFDYMLSNPPFGVDWKKIQKKIQDEHKNKGYEGRFGPGLPRVSDGSLLFLLHLIKRMRPREQGGSRIGIVLNGSALYTGGAGSGESEIRRYLITHDYVEAIIALPTDMFYNTGIATYIWVLSNNKAGATPHREGKIQLIDASESYEKLIKPQGDKRKELSPDQVDDIVRRYGSFEETARSKIFSNRHFGYSSIPIERPLRMTFSVTQGGIESALRLGAISKLTVEDQAELESALKSLTGDEPEPDFQVFLKTISEKIREARITLTPAVRRTIALGFGTRDLAAPPVVDNRGTPFPDPELRDVLQVPLDEDIDETFKSEVLPYAPDAWLDMGKVKVGYELPFNRYFYKFTEPTWIEELDSQLRAVEASISALSLGTINGAS